MNSQRKVHIKQKHKLRVVVLGPVKHHIYRVHFTKHAKIHVLQSSLSQNAYGPFAQVHRQTEWIGLSHQSSRFNKLCPWLLKRKEWRTITK